MPDDFLAARNLFLLLSDCLDADRPTGPFADAAIVS